MKKVFLSMSMLFMIAATTLASETPVVSEKVKASFQKEFASAELVQWSEQGDYLKATFIMAGSRTVAYFNTDGDLQGSLRSILYNQLPLAVITAIDKRFTELCAIDVTEISNVNGTSYKLTLESQQKKYDVRVDASGNITDVEKMKK